MKFIYQITVLTVFGIFATFTNVTAQLFEVGMDEKIEKSSLIIEGKVVQQESYLASDGEVYTANKIAVQSVLKGNFQDEFLTVTTWGGETEEEIITWSHLLELRPMEEGIFFLTPSRVPMTQNPAFPNPSFDVYAEQQGFIKYVLSDAKAVVGVEPFNDYYDINKDALRYISDFTGQERITLNGLSDSERSGIRYFIKVDSVVGTTVHFKVNVNTLYSNRQLHNAGAVLEYNTDCFGSSVATSGNLQIQTGGISTNTVYSLTKSDITESKVKIEAETVGSVTGLSTLTTSEQVLAKGSMTVLDIFEAPEVTFDVADMYELSKYYESGVENEFDTIIVETDFEFDGFFPAMKIDSIRPLSLRAGVGDVLTIYGCEFGDEQGNSKVYFSDASVGINQNNRVRPLPDDYVLWSDNVIRVEVPTAGYHEDTLTIEYYAGSGPIWVKVGNSTKKSSEELTVRMAAVNRYRADNGGSIPRRKVTRLGGSYSEEAGYNLYYTQDFKGLAGAVGAFERALCTWVDSSNVNFRVKEFSEIPTFLQNNACKIDLSNNLGAGVGSSVKAFTSKIFSLTACTVGDSVILYPMRKFDITFRKSENWYVDESYEPSFDWEGHPDLQSLALHELGHAQLLLHVNQMDDVMWYEVFGPKRELKAGDVEGGNYIKGISTVAGPNDCIDPMATLSACVTTPTNEVKKLLDVEIFPNPATHNLNVKLEDAIGVFTIRLYDQLGSLQNTVQIFDGNIEIDLSTYHAGIYYLNLSDESGASVNYKIIKL